MKQDDEQRVTLQTNAGGVQFTVGMRVVAALAAPTVATTTLPVSGATRAGDRIIIDYAAAGWQVQDRLTQIAPGQFEGERVWRNVGVETCAIVLNVAVQRGGSEPFYLIPAVNYNGNGWGGGQEPKGFYDTAVDPPAPWIFGGDRASIPGCTISEHDGQVVALFGTPTDAAAAGCALEPCADGLTHTLYWPLQEAPRSYRHRDHYLPAITERLALAPGESATRHFYLLIRPAPTPGQGYSAVLDLAWARFYHHVPARFSPQELWTLGIRFAKEQLWVASEEFVGFSIGLQLRDGQWIKRPHWRYEIGWCGQNAGLAAMFLQDFRRHGDEDSWQRGAAALDFWATQGRFANGLFYTHFDHKLAGVANPDLDTCNLGHGAYQYLIAAEIAEAVGRPQPLWREMGLGVCDFFVEHALPNGKLGRVWTGDGQCKAADGTIGCSLVWPLAKAYQMTGKAAYLQTAARAYRAYAEDDLAQLRCTAGALDTDCIDKETAFALLLPGVDLYEITGDPYYLAQAERAAYYLASWQWHYTLRFGDNTPAATLGYDTFGGTSVSAQHHHLDPWGALITLGWLRLGQVTGKRQWTQRAATAWRQATIGISDGTLTLNGVTRPVGGQDEGFYHTRWSGQPGYGPGDVSDWLVAWPTAFRLITLHHWPQWADLA